MKLLFLIIDGVGLREPALDNPVNNEVCPQLCKLIANNSVAIDACLGVEGLPQSATGQAAIFTGCNCSALMGRHCEGFPGPVIRNEIEKNNIFLELDSMGKKVCFADAYLIDSPEELALRRFKSASTVMALTLPKVVRTAEDLINDNAVMQDITRETIQDRYPDIPIIAPQRAAEHLCKLANQHDFTFFEFFQTDVSGHSLDYERSCAVLRIYDRFLAVVCRMAEMSGITVVITSDHGNIENMSLRTHTFNKVPFIAKGPKAKELRDGVTSLLDVKPSFIRFFKGF
jgi:hypothetical protein